MKKAIFLLFLGLLISCKPQEKPKTIPTVTTGDITEITTTTATCTSEVTADGGAEVTARGVCWSTSEEPTIADSKTEDGTGLGEYTSSITDLTLNTTYYVRAYATNSEGTAYGEQITFTTKEVQTTPPTVTTGEITDITTTTASCPCEVTDDGGAEVTARGVCWSTSEEPTTAGSKTEDGTGTGTYTSNITGLAHNTTYYVRAYATNSESTAYGEQRTFITKDIEYGSLTDERDNNVYKTIQIGDQIWMAENLKYLPSVVGPETYSDTNPYYYVYGYDGTDVATAKAESNYQTYGVIYNWPAAMNKATSSTSNPSGVQGACPTGWHLPSYAEWAQLEDYLVDNGYCLDEHFDSDGGKRIAKSLAIKSVWDVSENAGAVGNSDFPEYRNKSGFSALPGGCFVAQHGGFMHIGSSASWWSSSEIEYDPIKDPGVFAPNKWGIGSNSIGLSSEEVWGSFGMSVRCVKD